MAAPTRAAAFSGEILPVDLPISATTTTSGSEVAEKSASARRSRGCQRAAVEQRRDAADREQKGDEQWHSQQAVGAREKRGDIDLGPARDEEDRDEETEPESRRACVGTAPIPGRERRNPRLRRRRTRRAAG